MIAKAMPIAKAQPIWKTDPNPGSPGFRKNDAHDAIPGYLRMNVSDWCIFIAYFRALDLHEEENTHSLRSHFSHPSWPCIFEV